MYYDFEYLEFNLNTITDFSKLNVYQIHDKELLNIKFLNCLSLSKYIEKAIVSGRKIVLDRYIYSILVYHFVDITKLSDYHIEIYRNLIQPQLFFLISTNHSIHTQRNPNHSMDKLSFENINRNFIKNMRKNTYKINNSGRFDDSTSQIDAILNDQTNLQESREPLFTFKK